MVAVRGFTLGIVVVLAVIISYIVLLYYMALSG